MYAAIGELSVRHGYLDEEIAYFYAKLGEAIGAGVPPIEHRFFNDKLKLLAKLSEQDSNKECAERLEQWIEEADRANKLRNEAVHSTFSILEKDEILGPTQYLQTWKRANLRKVADVEETTIVAWPREKKNPTASGRRPSCISLRVMLSIAAMWSASKACRSPKL